MNIKGNKVTLRAMEKADMEMICNMFNDPFIEDNVVGWAFPLSLEQQNTWFEKNIEADGKNFRFVIDSPKEGAVGIATLTNIDWKNRSAFHGIKLANKEHRQKGVGTDAVMAIMRYAFDEIGLHRLDSSWFEDNIASKNLYIKCGWKAEGVKKECIYKHGVWRDLTFSGILVSDYRALVKHNEYWSQQEPKNINTHC